MSSDRGFIVHAVERVRGGTLELDYLGRLEGGETFAVVERRRFPFFHVREADLRSVKAVMDKEALPAQVSPSDLRTMDGAPTVIVPCASAAKMRRMRDTLHREGIRTYEADVKPSSRHLMDLRIRGTVEIDGPWRPGRRVARVYENPTLSPAAFRPALTTLSLDIETDAKARAVYAVALSFRGPGSSSDEVLLCGQAAAPARSFPGEKELLLECRRRILELDPDIITGWNVIDFDIRVLSERFAALGVGFDIGRSDSPARFLDREGVGEGGIRWKRSRAIVDGRQVLDGLWLARMAGLALEDYKLETVAQALLGKGKLIERLPGESATASIERLYRTAPARLAAYCGEDARLVLEILAKEGLLELAVEKSLLIGTQLDQTSMSVATFEHVYMEHLHARGFVAPTLGIDQAPLARAPGGGIITPRAGLYEGILVFDFKSLYPSIMRTFNIDPLARAAHSADPALIGPAAASFIVAPNGERFGRGHGILPEILDRFTESRERAKREGNRAASYAYKIVMNSFYGVLGTESCRFASSGLAGAITSFGQHILFRTRDRIKALGRGVIYGDTDSLFVVSGLTDPAALDAMGAELCVAVNAELAEYVRASYGVESRLELEFEGCYERFFLPPMRTVSPDADSEDPGRAKGYAGLRGDTLEIVGMEAVRHDWTPLAQELQRNLLTWVFHDMPAAEIEERIIARIARLRAGEEDSKLAYRKLLRKPVEAYTKSSPPHVRAAALLPPEERSGLIRYVWTREGPRPESAPGAPPDYEHYVEKQMRPIVEAVAPYTGIDTRKIFAAGGQMELF